MAKFGNLWENLGIYGKIWESMGKSWENVGNYEKIMGNRWKTKPINGG